MKVEVQWGVPVFPVLTMGEWELGTCISVFLPPTHTHPPLFLLLYQLYFYLSWHIITASMCSLSLFSLLLLVFATASFSSANLIPSTDNLSCPLLTLRVFLFHRSVSYAAVFISHASPFSFHFISVDIFCIWYKCFPFFFFFCSCRHSPFSVFIQFIIFQSAMPLSCCSPVHVTFKTYPQPHLPASLT